jgi:hypothetical protein
LKLVIRRSDQGSFPETTGSVLIHYLLAGSSSRPAGKFVLLAELAGPLFKQSSYSQGALKSPVIKRFQGRIPELLLIAEFIGGRQVGISGLDSVSMIFDLLPNILLQLIFYDKNDEFPDRATLLLYANATQLIDFESLAVLVTIFVRFLTQTLNN